MLNPCLAFIYRYVCVSKLFLEKNISLSEIWLVVWGFYATLTAKVHIMAVSDAYVFAGFLTPVLTQLFFPQAPTTFLTCFCRGERRNYAGKKSCLHWESNSQPPGQESDTLTTEPSGRGSLSESADPRID